MEIPRANSFTSYVVDVCITIAFIMEAGLVDELKFRSVVYPKVDDVLHYVCIIFALKRELWGSFDLKGKRIIGQAFP